MFTMSPIAFDAQTSDLNRRNQTVNELGWLMQQRPPAEHPFFRSVSMVGRHLLRRAREMALRPKTTAAIGPAMERSGL